MKVPVVRALLFAMSFLDQECDFKQTISSPQTMESQSFSQSLKHMAFVHLKTEKPAQK